MAAILVVGATGQLGTAVIDRLAVMEQAVRALVRPGSPREFTPDGVELVRAGGARSCCCRRAC